MHQVVLKPENLQLAPIRILRRGEPLPPELEFAPTQDPELDLTVTLTPRAP